MKDTFATIVAGTRAKAAEITDRVTAKQRENADASQRMREANEKLTKQLDERARGNAERNADPHANDEWRKPVKSRSTTFSFGPAEEQTEAAGEQPVAAEPERPAAERAVPETTEPEATPRPSGRHARRDEFDDDDYSNNSWMK
ncbi:hypothetical protein CFN78_01540 [Amycolatopsis antarctica]|uniref:Uncharacterized protein n=1 Tax=Amycolatopsis antarctica TaxID=1854586 RepID=A0A263D8T4_9PSEU|nr:hypothetical protein CFN78_01540 [Amycolatopsis antarctica]